MTMVILECSRYWTQGWTTSIDFNRTTEATYIYRGPAPFHRLTPNKRFEPVFSTVIMAVCSLFNRMLLLTDLIPVYLLYCGQTVMIGCNHISFEWTRAVRHIYGIIRHMQGLYECFISPVDVVILKRVRTQHQCFLTKCTYYSWIDSIQCSCMDDFQFIFSVANAVAYPPNWATLKSPAASQKTVGRVT